MAKFFFFESIVAMFYDNIFTAPRETYGKPTQLGITFASGYLAGVICAIVSHPADSLVSLMGKEANKGKSLGAIASETGLATLATKGLGTRIIMIGESASQCVFVVTDNAGVPARYSHGLPVVVVRLVQDSSGLPHQRWQVSER